MDADQTRSSALNISHLYYNEGTVPNDWDNPLLLATYYMTYKIGEFLLATYGLLTLTGNGTGNGK